MSTQDAEDSDGATCRNCRGSWVWVVFALIGLGFAFPQFWPNAGIGFFNFLSQSSQTASDR